MNIINDYRRISIIINIEIYFQLFSINFIDFQIYIEKKILYVAKHVRNVVVDTKGGGVYPYANLYLNRFN